MLPSRGVNIDLLSDILEKPASMVRTLLDEAATLGSVHITRHQNVEFIHDKHHQAAWNLIDLEERPQLCIMLANKLEKQGDDYIFSRADLIMEATSLDPDCYSIPDKARISKLSSHVSPYSLIKRFAKVTSAAHRAVRVAALSLAEKYLQDTRSYASFTSATLWDQNPSLALELTTIQAEVAMAAKKSVEILPEVSRAGSLRTLNSDFLIAQILRARALSKSLATKIEVSALIFRLNVSVNDTETARQTFRDVFEEIGIAVGDRPAAIPSTAQEVDAIIDDIKRNPKQKTTSAEDEMVIALEQLCATAGATLYSYSTDHFKEYFDHAVQLIVSNPIGRRHPSSAYTYTMHALLAAGVLNVELARAWLRLANLTKEPDMPCFSSIEAFVVTLEFLNCASITDLKYGAAYDACLAYNNMDTLTYAAGLDLAGSFLAGRDLRYTLDTGKKVLRWLQDDLSPASQAMIASSIQLAANCSDTQRDLEDLAGES